METWDLSKCSMLQICFHEHCDMYRKLILAITSLKILLLHFYQLIANISHI